jgi:hypothetical protein
VHPEAALNEWLGGQSRSPADLDDLVTLSQAGFPQERVEQVGRIPRTVSIVVFGL